MSKKIILLLPLFFVFIALIPKELKANEFLLKKEDRGEAVVELQQKLIALEYLHSNATGYYGELTEAAVRQFQYDFNLLSDGVAGPQTLNQLKEVEKIARIVHGEARGEPYKGQVAVAAVVKNRLKSPDFPSSVEGVIYQRNAFTAVMDGQYNLTPTSTSYKAVRDAWNGWDPSEGATYYYNPAIATSEWIFKWTTPKFTIGKHLFAE
ncbi:cell wall hydrolase [Halalkalibacter alkaliphilus]|uniref:Cell wall hydrolase n=1 Tax=Halalkalibacter alkaliphilus TaxID=2917993 RepID=A0A9X2I6V5_9BACI|nr:cell wall hydrolase [Halalkalibacter alkaliphilus]MCL7747984.1 cell wall hydrolase [Halalkalibacter alkaliphilus]